MGSPRIHAPALHQLDLSAQRGLQDELGADAFARLLLGEMRRAKPATFEALFTAVVEFVEPEGFEESFAWALTYLDQGSGVPDALPGWDLRLRLWLAKLAVKFAPELEASLTKLSGAALEMAGYCLYQVGAAELDGVVLARISKHFLNASAGRYAFEGKLPLTLLVNSCEELLLKQRFPILQRSRLEQLTPFLTHKLRVGFAVNYCGQDFRRVGVELLSALTEAQSAQLLALFQREPAISLEGGIVLGLTLALSNAAHVAETGPVVQALLLDLRSGSLEDIDVTERALRALPQALVQQLLATTLQEARTTVLVPALADTTVVGQLLERLETGRIDLQLAETALLRSGVNVVPLLLEFATQKKRGAVLGGVVARVLGQLGHLGHLDQPVNLAELAEPAATTGARAAELLVSWLGHPSKVVAAAAQQSLEKLGEAAKHALIQGTNSTRRVVRDASISLLARFAQQPALATPLDRIAAQAAELGEAASATFLRRCAELSDSPQKWPALLRPMALKLGALALHWLRPWFAERVPRHDARLWCYVVTLLKEDAAAVWVACDSFARLPSLPTSAWSGPRDALAQSGPLLSEPITHLLSQHSSEQREPLFKLLAKQATAGARELLTQGLLDPRKSIRTSAVDGLSRLSDVDVGKVAGLLKDGSLGTRLCVAELLAVLGRSETADAVLAAHVVEKSSRVRPYLEEALVACGRAASVFGETPCDSLEFEAALETFLSARARLKLPRFLELEPLPELHYRSGAALSAAAAQGLLSLVQQLDFTWKGRLLRALKPAFAPDTLAAWSAELHRRWARAKDTRYRWAVLQLWVLASESTVSSVAAGLAKLRPTEHTAVACYLKTLEWRASAESISWLFHWWNALRSRGLRALARELLGRVALRRGVPFQALCAEVNVWVREEQLERAAQTASDLTKLLESSWLSGRTFSPLQLKAWQEQFPGVVSGVLFLIEQPASAACWTGKRLESRLGKRVLVSDTAVLRLLHPIQLQPTEASAWQRRLKLLALSAPFPQLERSTFFYGTELDLNFAELATDSLRLEAWRRREHWFHGQPVDLGLVTTNSRRIPGAAVVARLEHSGYTIGAHDDAEPVAVLQLRFEDLLGHTLSPAELEPVLYSELCRSVSQVCAPVVAE